MYSTDPLQEEKECFCHGTAACLCSRPVEVALICCYAEHSEHSQRFALLQRSRVMRFKLILRQSKILPPISPACWDTPWLWRCFSNTRGPTRALSSSLVDKAVTMGGHALRTRPRWRSTPHRAKRAVCTLASSPNVLQINLRELQGFWVI